jgi:GT2 family glycosyltransferase
MTEITRSAAERYAIVLPVGPGNIANTLDTIDSILHYSDERVALFIVDDHTEDGTFEALSALTDDRIVLLRGERSFGYRGLHATVAIALRAIVAVGGFTLVFRVDWDALITGPGVCEEAATFFERNPHVGICGRHLINYDGSSKTFDMHTRSMLERVGWPPRDDDREIGGIGWIANMALKNGWGLGENVFGGAFFIRTEAVERMLELGFLDYIDNPDFWVIEDVFLTMCVLATGFDRAHFAMPLAPLALAYGCLPAPAAELYSRGMKVLHSVDKGRFTTAEENDGVTPREFFRRIRESA